jgi:hypothetical protein
MRRRPSLAMLMTFVAILAVGLAAMKVASIGMMRASFAVGVFALLTGTLGALARRGVSWTGFALFGWSYALVSLTPPIRDVVAPLSGADETIGEIARWLHPRVPKPASQPSFGPSVKFDETSRSYLKMSGLGSSDPLVPLSSSEQKVWDVWAADCDGFDSWQVAAYCGPRIGHVLAALSFGCLGALVGHLLDDPSRPAGTTPDARKPSNIG